MSIPTGVLVNLRTRGKATNNFLSVAGTQVDCWSADDASGRQRWVFSPVPESATKYTIRMDEPGRKWFLTGRDGKVVVAPTAEHAWVVAPRAGGGFDIVADGSPEFGFLSVHDDSWDNGVDLWSSNDGSGRQTWYAEPLPTAPKTNVPPGAAARLAAACGLAELQIDAIQSLVACPENSTTNWARAYGFAKFLGDGRGITFGIVGFCSGTGDGVLVLRKTAAVDASCPVSKYAGAMAKTRGEDRTGLGGFEAAAKASADNAAYREAQWSVATDLYWKFAVDYCAKKGRSTGRPGPVMKSPLAIGAMYDTALNHGPNGFGKIEKGMADATSGPEGRWITDFEESRYRLLKSGYQDLDTSGTGARARIWQQLVKEGNWDLKRPINVYKGNGAYWGAQVIR